MRRVHQPKHLAIAALACCVVIHSIGCNPSSNIERNDTVIPTPPVLSGGGESLNRIGLRGFLVSYAGASKAPREVVRSKQEASERAKMVATIAQMSGEHFQELTLKYGDRPLFASSSGDVLV